MKAIRTWFLFTLLAVGFIYADPAVNINPNDEGRPRGADDHMLPPDPRLPTPLPQKLKVVRGETITIDLKTLGDHVSQRVDYVVRERTAAGEVTDPKGKPDMRSEMTVTYTPDPDSEATTDFFTFGASYPNGRVSAPVKIELTIIDSEPVLVLPPNVNFGPAMVGGQSVRTIPIENTGTGPFNEKIELEPPWAWIPDDGETTCLIKSGERRFVSFSFNPLEQGTKTLRFGWGEENTKSLFVGEGFLPFQLSSNQLSLTYDPNDRCRKGELTLVSNHPQGLPVRIESGSNLNVKLPGNNILQRGQATRLRIQLGPENVAAFQGEMKIFMGEYGETVSVSGKPSPAHLYFGDGEPVLEFGSVHPGEVAMVDLTLGNIGGQEMSLELEVPEPFSIEEGDAMRTIPPQTAATWKLRFRPTEAGDYTRTLALGQGLEYLVLTGLARKKAEMVESTTSEPELIPTVLGPATDAMSLPNGSSKSSPNSIGSQSQSKSAPPRTMASQNGGGSSSAPPRNSGGGTTPGGVASSGSYIEMIAKAMQKSVSPANDPNALLDEVPKQVKVGKDGFVALPKTVSEDGFIVHSPFRKKTNPKMPRIEKVGLLSPEANSVGLIWEVSDGFDGTYGVEIRGTIFNKTDQRYEAVWLPYDKVKLEIGSDVVKAKVHGLGPDSNYNLRVFTVAGDGSSGIPSRGVVASTTVNTDEMPTWMIVSLVLLVFLAAGISYTMLKRFDVF